MRSYNCYDPLELAQIFGVSINDIRDLFHEDGQTFDFVDLIAFKEMRLEEAEMIIDDIKNENLCQMNCESCNTRDCEHKYYVKLKNLGEKILQMPVSEKIPNSYFLIQWDY